MRSISNGRIYYSFMVCLFMAKTFASASIDQLSIFFDSIANKNNNNWTSTQTLKNLSLMTCAVSLGKVIGITASSHLAKLNLKFVVNTMRLIIGTSLLLFSTGNFWIMFFSKLVESGTTECFVTISSWAIKEITVSNQKESFITLLVFFASIGHVVTSVSGSLDPGSFWYWRMHSIIIGIYYLIQIPLDLILCPYVNSYSYFSEKYSKEEIVKITSHYYTREAATEKIEQFLEDKQATQRLESQDNSTQRGSYLKEYLKDIKNQKEGVIHIIIFAILAMFAFRNMLLTYQVVFSSKGYQLEELSQPAKVMSSWTLAMGSILTLMTSLFRLNKRRRLAFIASHTICISGMVLLCVCYYFEKLTYAKWSIFLANLSYPLYWPTLLVYMNDICDSRTLFFCPLFLWGMDFVINFVVGSVFDFEMDSYHKLAAKFGCFALLGIVANIVLRFMMIETDGRSKVWIVRKLRGESLPLSGEGDSSAKGVGNELTGFEGFEDGSHRGDPLGSSQDLKNLK